MMRPLMIILATIFVSAPVAAAPAKEQPDYIADLDRAYHAGDWTLQCNSSRFCQIIGVVKAPKSGIGVRTVVMIRRGVAKGAAPTLRLAFIDSMGSTSVPPPQDGWRLYSRGLPKIPPPLRLGLGAADANGAYRAAPDAAAKLIGALRRWPGSVIHNRGQLIARMPKGDLARLFRKMDRLQHPRRPRMTAAEEAQWLQEYHYVVQRAQPSDAPMPDSLNLVCDTRTYINQARADRVGPDHLLWTIECPEGYKVYMQQGDKEPQSFDLKNFETGKVSKLFFAGFNSDTSLIEMHVSPKGDAFCGQYLKFGFSDASAFALISYQRYDRCRAVPQEYWPVLWNPTSWKYADSPPSDGGNAPPSVEGVLKP